MRAHPPHARPHPFGLGRVRSALMTTAIGVGFLAGGTIAALADARATYVTAGLGGLAVIAWTLARLRTPADPKPALAALSAA